MAGLPCWASARDLVTAGAVLAGYAWLAVLSARMRALSRRLGSHICREPDTGRAGGHTEASERVSAADILRRERGTTWPMSPRTPAARAAEVTRPTPAARAAEVARPTPAARAAEVTHPMPAVRTDDDRGEERYW